MKAFYLLIAIFSFTHVTNGNLANYLADKVLLKLSSWVKTEGSHWLTVAGYFNETSTQAISFAGPNLTSINTLTREGDATLDYEEGDSPSQLNMLFFLPAVALDYNLISYRTGNENMFLTARITTDGLRANVAINIQGSGDSCVGGLDVVDVFYDNTMDIVIQGSPQKQDYVENLLGQHMNNVVPQAFKTMMSAAIFNGLQGYDICSGATYPVKPAKTVASDLIDGMTEILTVGGGIKRFSVLPGFSNQTTVNDTNLVVINADAGYFSSMDSLRSLQDAVYEDDFVTRQVSLKFSLSVENLVGNYDHIEYIDYETYFIVGEIISISEMSAAITITFSGDTDGIAPYCSNPTIATKSIYDSFIGLIVLKPTTDSPDYVLQSIGNVLVPEYLSFIEGAVDGLINKAVTYALNEICK